MDINSLNTVDNHTPVISALMCVYNKKKEWLCEAIDSILNQSFRDFEFIIVLDCPTDDSESIVQSYAEKDERIVILKNEENIGLTKSLNRGLAVARGIYIARMDSDDISLPNRFEKQVLFMETHPETAVVGARVFTPGVNNVVQYGWIEDQQALKIRFLFSNVGVPHPTAFIRHSVLTDYNLSYTESVRKSQDYKLWVDILPYGKIIMLPDILLLYRVHENQISADASSQNNYAHGIAIEQAEKLLGKMTDQEKQIHSWFSDPKHTEGGKKGYKAYIRKLIKANEQKKIYDSRKFKREMEFMWCQKAWRRALLMHHVDFLLDWKTFVFLKPNVFRYTNQYKQAKVDYEAAIKLQESNRQQKL